MAMRVLAIAVPGVLLALAGGATAQEFCVTCKGPDASYRCTIGGDPPAGARSARGQFLCITEIAKAGGHASCSATRAQDTPCPGPTRTVMFPPGEIGPPPTAEGGTPLAPVSPAPLPPPAPPVGAVTQPAPHPQPGVAYEPPPPPAAPPAEEKPNAVEDLANKTGKALNDSGKAVGNAVKKSWDCVTSLFGNC